LWDSSHQKRKAMNMTKAEKAAIRNQLFVQQDGRCAYCPKILTSKTAHMHERKHRGQGGKISLENSVILCSDCHLNQEHGDRKPQFSKKEPNTDEPDFIYDLVREDGRLERMCKHGIGHTVGHLDSRQLTKKWVWVHGCDGCCHDYARMKSS
jgi:hypothetical protein